MFKNTKAISGFSVDDLEKARRFYNQTLGVDIREEEGMGLILQLSGGMTVFIYPKENHQPATFTVLNFMVDDIDAAVDALKDRGVQFEHYADDKNLPQDEKGILRGLSADRGPDIAWFKDPAGNILSIIQEK